MKHQIWLTKLVCLATLLLFVAISETTSAQPAELPARAFSNVTLHNADGTTTEGASIVWRGGVIEAVGTNITIPFDARVIDGGDSLHVYPGFINGYATWGSPDREQFRGSADIPGRPGYNRAGIQMDRSPELLLEDKPVFKEALKAGFTTSVLGLNGYILPGHLSVFNLSDKEIKNQVYRRGIAQHFQFDFVRGAYPSTLMATMTRLRQLFHDAEALKSHQQLFANSGSNPSIPVPNHDAVLEALFPVLDQSIPLFVHADSPADIERVLRLKAELGFNLVLVGGKQAWSLADKIAAANVPVLLAMELPEKPDWMKAEAEAKTEVVSEEETEAETETEIEKKDEISDEEKHFRERQTKSREQHLNNLRVLLEAGVKVGVSLNDLKLADLNESIQSFLEHGYTASELLNMMTAQTATIIGQGNRMGALRTGMIANMAVFEGSAFDKKPKAIYTVSAGQLFNLKALD